MIDKELRAYGRVFRIFNRSFTERRLRLFNRLSRLMAGRVRDTEIGYAQEWITRADGSKMRVCLFYPKAMSENMPGVLWLHGGGYALGTPELALWAAKKLIAANPCVVAAPDYRLSVEAPYPAALDDCYDALLWLKSRAKELGIRDDQLMVGGDSAGGGLTAALTLLARDRGEVAIAFQMPLYPMLDDRMLNPSAIDNDAPVWNSISNVNAWKLYLGALYGGPDVPVYAAAARAEDYNGLPPMVTFVGELEPFLDETVRYADSLKKAGVPVAFEVFPGCFHGFDQICPKSAAAKKATELLINAYRYAAAQYSAPQKSAEPQEVG